MRMIGLCLSAFLFHGQLAAQTTAAAPASAPASAGGGVPVRVQYIQLISATNYVQQLRSRKDPIRPEEAITATKLACDGLRQIAYDADLFDRIAHGAPAAERHDGLNETLRNSLSRFIDDFLRPESDLLRKAGLSEASVAQIAKDGYDLSSYAYIGKYGELNPGIQKNLKVFTGEVCRAADAAKQIAATKTRDAVTRLGIGLGSAAVIAIDASFMTAAPEVSPVAAASLSWGFTALTEAVKTSP